MKLKNVSTRLAAVGGRLKMRPGEIGTARGQFGKSSAARGYGYQWQKARAAYLAQNPLCAMCSTDMLPVAADVVDHIKPHGGDRLLFWDQNNWQPLCKHCHSSTKQRIERGGK